MNRLRLFFGAAMLAVSVSPILTSGQGTNDIIAQSGDAAPDSNGTLVLNGQPLINQAGQVAFWSQLLGTSGGSTDNEGIFRGSGGPISQLAREGQLAPDSNGTYSDFFFPSFNNSGEAAFRADLIGTSGGTNDNSGIFRAGDSGVTQIARKGETAPDTNGTYSNFFSITRLNDNGHAAFYATLSGTSGGSTDDSGIFRGDGGVVTQIVREGQAAPDSNGVFAGIGGQEINRFGQVAFHGSLTGTSGGTTDNSGVFRGSGGAITQIARKGQAAPDANGVFDNLGSGPINDSGQVAFRARLSGTTGGFADDWGIFRGNGGAITQIAREGEDAPDSNGTIASLSTPNINNSGQAAFTASLTGTSGGLTDNEAIYRGDGGLLTQIVREGQATPDSNGLFGSLFFTQLNNSGQVVFRSSLTGTSGGNTDDGGIFAGDGIDLIQVAREGDSLAGSTISSVTSGIGVNDFGQVSYLANLVNGEKVISRWTPDLHWRTNINGQWDDNANWTLSLNPAHVHNVFIDPEASLTVDGPTSDASVHNLFVGTDGINPSQGQATLNLQQGRTIDVDNVMIIGANGTLTGDGRISGATGVFNDGTIVADNITIDGPINALFNANGGVIEGNGRLHADLYNFSSGNIRATDGNVLRLTGPTMSNSGLVEVIDGELRVNANVSNNVSTGMITGRDATMRFNGGVTNNGAMAFSYGISDVFGDIDNTGTVSIGGGAQVTFYDDIVQNGTFEVVAIGQHTSSAVIFGDFSGAGGFSGGGDVFLLGDLRPGNSPASVLMDGNLYLGSSTQSLFEIAGRGIGEFDQLLVTGDLTLSGDFQVDLLDGHQLRYNEEYLIADVGHNLYGEFDGLSEGSLVGNFGGIDLFITYDAGTGNDIGLYTAVPEPGALGLVLIGSVCLLAKRGRRQRQSSNFTEESDQAKAVTSNSFRATNMIVAIAVCLSIATAQTETQADIYSFETFVGFPDDNMDGEEDWGFNGWFTSSHDGIMTSGSVFTDYYVEFYSPYNSYQLTPSNSTVHYLNTSNPNFLLSNGQLTKPIGSLDAFLISWDQDNGGQTFARIGGEIAGGGAPSDLLLQGRTHQGFATNASVTRDPANDLFASIPEPGSSICIVALAAILLPYRYR